MTSGIGITPLSLALALTAGLVSFFSPCVLPLVPAYVGFITGRSAEELRSASRSMRAHVLRQGLAFVLGLACIFTALGASASLIGEVLGDNQPILWKAGGAVVVLFGLHMMGLFRLPGVDRTLRLLDVRPGERTSYAAAFMLGAAFGGGWVPCVGPFLASVLTLASTENSVGEGALLLLVYALGLGLPFLAAGLAIERALIVSRGLRPHLRRVEQLSGVLLVGMGLLLFSDQFALIAAWLTRIFGTGIAL